MTTAIDNFLADGFVAVRRAVAPGVVRTCVALIEDELRSRGIDPRNRVTWTKPVVRFACPEGPAFAAAGTSPALCNVYDQLLGRGRWIPRQGVGGTIPVRFPSTSDPGDAGWHIDGSYDVGGQWWVRRVRAHATGRAGDVYVCHPFLVHRATWPHRGSGPRMLAQPAIEYPQPFALREDRDVCAVERAILRGLERRDS
jgi:hypothetical protein